MDIEIISEGVVSTSSSRSPFPFVIVSLPPDVLGEVVKYLDGREIGRLWKCGHSSLNYKLSARGVVRTFELVLDSFFPLQWPSILSKLPHVSDMHISDNEYCRDVLTLENCSFDAPPALRALSLRFCGASRPLLRALHASPTMLSTLETLKIEGEQDGLSKSDAVILKSLKSLRFFHFRTAVSYEGALSELIPPNIIDFDMKLYDCNTIDFNLPQSLTSFNVSTSAPHTLPAIEAFPPGLTKFCLKNEDKTFTASEVLLLPRSLTYLNVSIDLSSPEIWSALPPVIRTLKSSYVGSTPTGAHMKLYPLTLTNTNWHPTITVDNIHLLPPGLTKLSKVTNNPHVLSKLPATLQSIQCGPPLVLSALNEFVSLPNSLTRLTRFNPWLLPFCTFPSTLKHLHVSGAVFTSNRTRFLPSGLDTLLLHHVDLDCLAGLPQGLTLLKAGEFLGDERKGILTTQLASNLPSNLTSLNLTFSHLESPETISALPRRLEDLTLKLKSLHKSCDLLKAPSSLKSLSITIDDDEDGLAHSLISTLPRKLREFILRIGAHDTLTNIGEEALQNLPIGLVNLIIPGSPALQAIKNRPDYLPTYLPPFRLLWTKSELGSA